MNSLPNEILSDVLNHLPQRYIFTICAAVCSRWNIFINQSFYSTIHIYSEKQLKGLIHLVKEKKSINGDTYADNLVRQLIFHFEYLLTKEMVTELLVFPNLQWIDGLSFEPYLDDEYNKSVYLQLNQSTQFSYWYDGDQWITKFNEVKNHLNSLNINITPELLNFIPNQQQQQQQLIEMKNIGMSIIKGDKRSIKKLVISKEPLIHLTKLEIDFGLKIFGSNNDLIINEKTLESIHTSCPSLESLSLANSYMIISDEYKQQDNNEIIPAYKLKNLKINYLDLKDPLCFQYIFIKYPYLNFLYMKLRLLMELKPMVEIELFQQAIFNMILQLTCLKKLIYKTLSYLLPGTLHPTGKAEEVWPHSQFISWLHQHSNRLSELEYPFDLVTTYVQEINNNHLTTPLKQQFHFLNHITSLHLRVDSAIHLALNYLLQYENTITVSTTLKHLTIERTITDENTSIFIYDWLDIFPNLLSLDIECLCRILVNELDEKIVINKIEDESIDTQNKFKLHQLIIHRKQQQQQQHHHHHHHENNVSFYKLKKLGFRNGDLYTKEGFEALLKKCHQLENLKLDGCKLVYPAGLTDDFHFDLSHLYLQSLYIVDLSYKTKFNTCRKYTNYLNIHETISNFKRTINVSAGFNGNTTLYLKCKFIDELICKRK